MRKLQGAAFAAALAFVMSAAPALAQSTGTYTDANGVPRVSQGVEIIGKNGSGQRCVVGVDSGCNLSTGGNSSGGGASFQLGTGGALPAITVSTSSHAAGTALGGLITVTGAARTAGGSGTLTNIRLRLASGATPTVWVYAWSKAPASGCTDAATYTPSAADAPYALPGFPQQASASAAGSWDSASYAQWSGVNVQFKNQDTTPGTPIYVCFVTATTFSPSSTSGVSADFAGLQD